MQTAEDRMREVARVVELYRPEQLVGSSQLQVLLLHVISHATRITTKIFHLMEKYKPVSPATDWRQLPAPQVSNWWVVQRVRLVLAKLVLLFQPTRTGQDPLGVPRATV
jgi:hypothetical protein